MCSFSSCIKLFYDLFFFGCGFISVHSNAALFWVHYIGEIGANMGLIGSGPTGNSSSSLLMTRFRRTKPSNAYWLGRSMEQLQTAAVGGGGIRDDKGSPSLPPSMGTLAAGPGSATSTPGRVPRHRLPTDPSGSASTLPTTMTSTSASSTDLQHQQLTDTNGDHPPKCKSFIHLFLRVIL